MLKDVFMQKELKYEREDVRWRHVGTYAEKSNTGTETTRHILYDLADLEQAEENSESWVEEHLDILKRRIGVEPEAEPEQLACQLVSDGGEGIACKTAMSE